MPPPAYELALVNIFNAAVRVVVVQLVLLPPTVMAAVNVVLAEPLVVILACKVWPDTIAPDVTHAPPLMLICAVAAPVTETDKPPLEHPVKVMVAVLLLTEVFNDCDVRLVNDNTLGDPHVAVLAARKRQFAPSQTSTFVSVVFQRSVPAGLPEQLAPAEAAALPRM